MATDTEHKDGNETADRAGKMASNAGNSQVRQVKNEMSSEMRQRFGFLNKITSIFKR